jgi:hypothetical protein
MIIGIRQRTLEKLAYREYCKRLKINKTLRLMEKELEYDE